MALGDNELYAETPVADRGNGRVDPSSLQVKKFAVGSGVAAQDTLPAGTPVAYNTSLNQWVPWDANGSNGSDEIRGIVFPAEVVLDATDEVLGVVMMSGKIHYNEILAAVETRAVEVEADLQTELRDASKLRDHGILVYGLTQTR